MDSKDLEKKIIDNYQKDEHMMILVFAQWCVNHDLDPHALYVKAYPNQAANPALMQAIELTVPKKESEEIPDQTLLGVLSLFGNDDLAFIVNEEIEQRMKKNS
ncbi:hypothetical protein [Pseudalkalibacillus berkeleyi]|uniref:YxiS n=1 Tax=Pseudalkalibacillus berkeleyi TaxID=1069813 RepID=A0ABS9H0P0_9BACL|nr:hypothetical protein [Pseudalkalibacillus berkeleyi]MCF6137481.1 hypothetical protein [Pseudalkalibacillus berkeleyi]